MKITVPRFKEVAENAGIKVAETSKKVTVNRTENEPPTENHQGLIEKLIERASLNDDKLSKNRIAILTLMIDNPYITKRELAKLLVFERFPFGATLKRCAANISAVSVPIKVGLGK